MSLKKRYTALMGAACGLLLLGGCGIPLGNAETSSTTGATSAPSNTASTATGVTVGANAPGFSLQELGGKGEVSLKQLLGKGPIILNAWASWCGPCQQEEPELTALAKQYAGKVTVIGINMTAEDSVSGAKQFVSKYHVSYPILLDSAGTFLNKYQLVGFPTTFLINGAGKIQAVHVGSLTKSQMQRLFEQAAKETTA
ncbi:TlpA family protein disulfide reductase [Alicyclobacillus mengziensis]|uniref:TlpA family protein disulfide reductase n=1 Tax=Alicyclobacillus mengziensis TaxID=2931921 RepID=A0A9X7Z695_9BACL|nr:TlpA disulfide reductase family protein [Alicyclobacillus mengziensis]QSO45993.1 TlpA family protein disulfide reductase [Alicyclobacillus mengziensis]